MRREELVMDILGGLDDSFIEEAMPRTGKYAVSDSAVAAAPITLVETGTEISKKDLRIYWITRALGMAAVVALIVGAVVLLVHNWDKIAVSGNERPGVVTSVTNGTVTPDITETDITDRFEQITDTSMPEPYPYNDHEYYRDFYYTWINRFSVVSGNLIHLPDMEKQNDLINYYTLNRAGTPYTLDDNLNLYSWMTKLDLSVDNVCRAIEENNEYYSSQPFGHSEEFIFNPYEIDVLKSGDRSRIAEAFATEYSIIIGDKVFNPEWLYYHTIEDYSAVGITPEEVLHKLDMYEGLGLTDEAWAAFREKLYKYISGEKDNTAVTTSAVTESNGTTAVAVTSATTTSNVIGGTTVISDTDSSADTTVPADDRPTDDELKALVEQGAEACGLKITVSDLTKASLKLNYYCEGDNSKYLAFMWGGKYEIQILSGNEWMTYDPDNFRRWNDEQMWFDSSFSINEFPDHSDEHETILFYGDNMYESEIPKGNYRVLKQIAVYGNGKNLGQLTAYAEFTIDEHTPNVFGITMTAKNVSPESVTLAVEQSGASFHVKRNLGYKARFVLERKTGSGEWKKVEGNPVTWAPDIEPINENGITEIKEDFSDIYGSLPDGTYRISKLFVNYVGTGETKDDILNSSTYYCEFVIGEKTHDWGITMSAKDVTPAGMTLLIDQKGGNATGELTYGEDFSIEVKSDEFGTWEKLGYITDEINWTDIGYILEPGAHNENQINWTYIYGYLPAGHYRLVKEFMDFRKTGDYDQCDFYMEFDVPEIDSKLGITLNTKRNTARWITLDAASIGDTVSEHMSFNENRYVIEQKKNGKWTEYYTTAVPGIPTPETARKINVGDVVTFTVDWRKRAGSLPVGEYRIGLTFTGGSVSETIYAEFTVEEYMTNEFGLQIRPIEVSRTGGRFAFESLGGDYNVRTLSDKEFSLQKQTAEGEWKTLSAAEGAVSRKSSSPTLTASTGGGSSGIMGTIEWKELFGTLSAGHYRLGKKFSAVIDGKTKEIMLYCEFDITADTPEKIGE